MVFTSQFVLSLILILKKWIENLLCRKSVPISAELVVNLKSTLPRQNDDLANVTSWIQMAVCANFESRPWRSFEYCVAITWAWPLQRDGLVKDCSRHLWLFLLNLFPWPRIFCSLSERDWVGVPILSWLSSSDGSSSFFPSWFLSRDISSVLE